MNDLKEYQLRSCISKQIVSAMNYVWNGSYNAAESNLANCIAVLQEINRQAEIERPKDERVDNEPVRS